MENEIVSSRPRKPLIHSLKEWRKPPPRIQNSKPFSGSTVPGSPFVGYPTSPSQRFIS